MWDSQLLQGKEGQGGLDQWKGHKSCSVGGEHGHSACAAVGTEPVSGPPLLQWGVRAPPPRPQPWFCLSLGLTAALLRWPSLISPFSPSRHPFHLAWGPNSIMRCPVYLMRFLSFLCTVYLIWLVPFHKSTLPLNCELLEKIKGQISENIFQNEGKIKTFPDRQKRQ